MDILAALNDHNPQRGGKRCKLQAHLDSIPPETPGRDDLIAAVNDADNYPAERMMLTLHALKLPVSAGLIRDHRACLCLCFR